MSIYLALIAISVLLLVYRCMMALKLLPARFSNPTFKPFDTSHTDGICAQFMVHKLYSFIYIFFSLSRFIILQIQKIVVRGSFFHQKKKKERNRRNKFYWNSSSCTTKYEKSSKTFNEIHHFSSSLLVSLLHSFTLSLRRKH